MHSTLTTLIDRLDSTTLTRSRVISWGSPVPSFGDLSTARVATVGLNPSNREFVDERGEELEGLGRRFHTLTSLGLNSWADVDARHLEMIMNSCREYFEGNPYDRWFRTLDQIVAGTNASYYDDTTRACHVDLIPYATTCKWTELTTQQRHALLSVSGDTLALLLRDSPVRILILNGRTVVDHFQQIACTRLNVVEMRDWSLPRQSGDNVRGLAYSGLVTSISGLSLEREMLVLGFNHNLQSSFGVTAKVVGGIRAWVSSATDSLSW